MDSTRVYWNVEAYYDDVPAARRSGESDYGVWWRTPDGATWRVSHVHATGDVYAVRAQDGRVLVLGRVGPPWEWKPGSAGSPAAEVLEGWADVCGAPDSLSWVIERVAQVSPGTAP